MISEQRYIQRGAYRETVRICSTQANPAEKAGRRGFAPLMPTKEVFGRNTFKQTSFFVLGCNA